MADKDSMDLEKRRSPLWIIGVAIGALSVVPIVGGYLLGAAAVQSHLVRTDDGWGMAAAFVYACIALAGGTVLLIVIPCCWRRMRPLWRLAFIVPCLFGLLALPLFYALVYWLRR